jgi:hypothetical protein
MKKIINNFSVTIQVYFKSTKNGFPASLRQVFTILFNLQQQYDLALT